MVDHIAAGLEPLHEWRAFTRRDYSTSPTEQIHGDAQRGNQFAARVIRSGILNDPKFVKHVRAARPAPSAPLKTKNQLAIEERSAAIRRRLEREAAESGIAWHIGAHAEAKFIQRRYLRARSS
jgi:hypothetical protein